MGRSASFKENAAEDVLQARTAAQAGGSGSLLRSGRGLRLGLGAVSRTTPGSAKGRGSGQGHKSMVVFSQPVQPVSPATNQKSQDTTGRTFTHIMLMRRGTFSLRRQLQHQMKMASFAPQDVSDFILATQNLTHLRATLSSASQQ